MKETDASLKIDAVRLECYEDCWVKKWCDIIHGDKIDDECIRALRFVRMHAACIKQRDRARKAESKIEAMKAHAYDMALEEDLYDQSHTEEEISITINRRNQCPKKQTEDKCIS